MKFLEMKYFQVYFYGLLVCCSYNFCDQGKSRLTICVDDYLRTLTEEELRIFDDEFTGFFNRRQDCVHIDKQEPYLLCKKCLAKRLSLMIDLVKATNDNNKSKRILYRLGMMRFEMGTLNECFFLTACKLIPIFFDYRRGKMFVCDEYVQEVYEVINHFIEEWPEEIPCPYKIKKCKSQ